MTFKEFMSWCNDRASDGCWGMGTAIYCANVINKMQSTPFWQRKNMWHEYEQTIVNCIVEPINRKIHRAMKITTDEH